MSNFSRSLSVNGWNSLAALMLAAGYTGTNALSSIQLVNNNAVVLNIHLTNDATVNPSGAGANPTTDGIAIGTTQPSVEWKRNAEGEDFVDAGSTWLYAPSAINVRVAAIGGGI